MPLPEPFQRSRARGARSPEGGVLVTRPGPWGNWIIPGRPGKVWIRHRHRFGAHVVEDRLPFPVSREEAVAWHRQWLDTGEPPAAFALILDGPTRHLLRVKHAATLAQLATLRGVRLGCWCSLPNQPGAPDLCHRATLTALANKEAPDANDDPGPLLLAMA